MKNNFDIYEWRSKYAKKELKESNIRGLMSTSSKEARARDTEESDREYIMARKKKEMGMPTQDQVDKFFELTQNQTHYLNSKPVAGQKKTFNDMEVEPWDEYDLSNWNSLVRKAKAKGKSLDEAQKKLPKFKNIPSWAKYLAQHSDGEWYFYEETPTMIKFKDGSGGAWKQDGNQIYSGVKTDGKDWDKIPTYYNVKNGNITESVNEAEEDPIDIITMDVPLFIRILEYSREDAQEDMDLHDLTEKAIEATKQQGILQMDDYDMLVGDKESIEESNLERMKEMLNQIEEKNPGLWANINAKQKRGEKPAHGNSNAFKSAVKAGNRINKAKS